jgi:hypothetical protein
MINIGIDCDGVQFNFNKAYGELIRKLFGTHFPSVVEEEVPHWNWSEWHPAGGELIDKAWSAVPDVENFWETLETIKLPHIQYMVEKLNNHPKVTVYFITARIPTKGNTVVKQTINALTKLGWKDPQVIVSFSKGPLASALNLKFFIDDRAENCADVAMHNRGTKVFILDKLHNRVLQDRYFGIHRVTNLTEFTDAVLDHVKS